MEVDESVTIDDGKELTLNLYGYTLTGTITVVGTLTLENGTVTGSIVNNGTLTLRMGENGLVIEYTADVITGNEYSVDEAACVRKQLSGDAVTRLELATSHGEKEYTAEGGTITLTCTICEKALGTVTLVAPEDLTFSGEKLEATVVVSPDGLIAETPAITYTDEAGEEVGEIINVGRYTASITLGGVKASVKFEVKQQQLVISEIQDEIAYQGDQALTLPITNYTLKDLAGNEVELDGITVTVTLQKSKYNVGTYVALITAISMTGNENYTLAVVGNQAFITITVNPTTLTVRVNGNGEVEYEGFVGGEDESVLGGTLTLEKVDNGDGTYTVTPSGFESENYNIVYVSGIVSAPAGTGASTPDYTLWIILGTLAAVAVVCGTVAIVCIRRKRD